MEPCTLIEPRRGASSTALGRIWPNATTTATSAPSARRRSGHSASRTRSGWRTSIPAARARSFTGGWARCWPRCAGRSGCVTTATTSWGRRSASRVGKANAGVPGERTVKREGVAGRVLAETFLLDLPLDAIAHHRVDAVDEEHAVQVVDLVLEDPRAQTVRLDRQGLAVDGTRLHRNPRRPRDRGEHARDREAALLAGHLAAPVDDCRVEERLHAPALLVGDDDETQRDAHLRRREADPDLVVHRLGHVGDDLADLGSHLADGYGALAQCGIPVFSDFQNGHSTGSTSISMIPRPALRALNSRSASSSRPGRSAPPLVTIRRMRSLRSAVGG